MCIHSDYAARMIQKIADELIPSIRRELDEVEQLYGKIGTKSDLYLIKIISNLKVEFLSLCLFEKELVFPAVLSVLNDKKAVDIDVVALQQQELSKETYIFSLVRELQSEAYYLALPESNPVWNLIASLKTLFIHEKMKWHDTLSNLQVNCTFFSEIQQCQPE